MAQSLVRIKRRVERAAFYRGYRYVILKTAENYTYLTFAHPVLKPLPDAGRGLERVSILSEVLNRSQYN